MADYSEDDLYLDNVALTVLLNDLESTSSNLVITDDAFNNAKKANGCNAMQMIVSENKNIQLISNLFHKKVTQENLEVVSDSLMNINNSAFIAANGLNFSTEPGNSN